MGQPAARVTDTVSHPIPPILTGGPGSLNVVIGRLPAWRGLPAAAGIALQQAKAESVEAIAEATRNVQLAPPPAKGAAMADLQVTITEQSAAMAATILRSAASGADLHTCVTPPPPAPPHGVGIVAQGSTTVMINGLSACRVGDQIIEALGPPNVITRGCPTVLIGG